MTYDEFCVKFHIQLNQQQLEAVKALEGPVLLLAVPGSGKTTVLVTRLGYMIYSVGILPENILTLTYTVAAAKDMEARFVSCFGDEFSGRLEFRTINGICAKVIQYYGKQIEKEPFALANDDKLTAGMLSDIYRQVVGDYATESDLKGIRTIIAYIKNSMLDADEIKGLDEEAGINISEIYRAYCKGLRSRGLMDYDDQLVYAYAILRKNPETLRHFRDRYQYICVDEAQDTSKIQHAIIILLAGRTDNLFMVGDEDQSIYGFRAAYPQALLSFEQNHPGAGMLLMEENFRSNAKIVEAADRFIRKNTLRHDKHMKAAREAGSDIRVVELHSRGAQYNYLVKVADGCQEQTAVLYRDNESVLPLVDRLERQGISYRIRNAEFAFFTHRVVLDIQNIILFALNPKDTELFLQIYYKLSTYIKKQDALRICEISRKKDMEVLAAAVRYGHMPDKAVRGCGEIRAHLKCLPSERADEAINRIVQSMGYRDYLKRAGMSDGKLYILRAIARNEDSPQRLVERLAELRHIFSTGSDKHDSKFILSTIHASKGLEYNRVYLLDVVDGIFPESIPANSGHTAQKEREAYEEERRLFYVGITRAKDMLCVFKLNQKSVFCRELTEAVPTISVQAPFGRTGQVSKSESYETEFRKFHEAIGEGLLVEHKRFGKGVVVEIGEKWVVVQFESDGRQRKLDLNTLFMNQLLK